MIDSTNPRSMADNIRKLWDKFKSISGDLLPSRSTATTGQILKLTGENKTPAWADEYSYTPPAYSETEVNTGQKWIDGKDIYSLTIVKDIPTLETAGNVAFTPITIGLNIKKIEYVVLNTSGSCYKVNNLLYYNNANGVITVYSLPTSYSEGKIIVVLEYTKPDPSPETRDDNTEEAPEEVKETKTRKKTTK